jgi:hypothetical protein
VLIYDEGVFWISPPDALVYTVPAVVVICATAVIATLTVPCVWREGGCLDRRRTRRT